MPIYEYRCDDCNRPFETFVRSAHDEENACPTCNSNNIRREMSVFSSGSGIGQVESNGNGAVMTRAGGCCGGSCGCH